MPPTYNNLPQKYGTSQVQNLADTYGENTLEAATPRTVYDKSAQQAQRSDLAGAGAISAGLQAAQLAAMLMPTAQDRENKKRLEELEKLRDQGRLGLTGAERAEAETAMLNPVRALATEQRQRSEAQMAGMGQQLSAADLQRAEKVSQQQAQDKAFQAGATISQMNLDRAQQQLTELQQRIAYKSERQKGRLEAGSQAIGQAGQLLGQVRATKAVPQLDLSQIPEESQDMVRDMVMEAMREDNPITRQRMIDDLNTLLSAYNTRQ